MKHIASCSFGKDSLAMVLLLIENDIPLDEVVFFDTGMEFKAIYNTRDKILPLLEEKGIKYTELKPKQSFEYKIFEKPVKKRGTQQIHKFGYGWCGGSCRWGTTEKLKAIDKYCKEQNAICYVGIAVDEKQRAEKNKCNWKRYPLIDFNISEKQALEYCYKKGFFFEEKGVRLYDILKRVSCWCCRNKNLNELYNYYKFLPEYWGRLKDFQSRIKEPMKKSGSVFELEEKFIMRCKNEKLQ